MDGEVYKTYELDEGEPITPEAEPTKEGYTFSGWGEIPSTMPDHDVTVSGTFSKNGSGTDDDNPSSYKSLDDYIANSTSTLQDYRYTINPTINNIKKVYVDLTKGTTNSLYCYLWIENYENTKSIDLSSKYVSTSSDNFIIHENYKSYNSNIKELVDNKTYSWLYYNPKNSNEVIIDIEAFFGCIGHIKGWQKNFGTSYIVNIVTTDTPSNIILGDTNGDGLVNETDIVATVNYIMEKPSEDFNKETADLNGDGKVNVTDIVKMVSIIMDSDGASSRRADATSSNLVISGSNIQLRNAEVYTAAQFDINLSDGQSITDVVLNCNSNHSLHWNMIDTNTCRVVVYSMTNAAFRINSDNLFNIFLNDSQNASISNEIQIRAEETNGIDVIRREAESGKVYDLNGRRVKNPTKGIYIKNDKKIFIK